MILKSDKKYLVENDLVNHSRFEFYLYKRACQKLDNGDFFVPESEQNKRLEDDLIPEDVWCRNKFKLIENTGLERLNTPIDLIITELGNKLSNKIAKACQRIDAQDNDFVTYLPKEAKLKWSIANRKWQEPVTNPIYSQVAHLNIIEILDFVQSKADFLRAFEHISKQRRNHGANPDDLLACIFGQGANYGIYKMSNISDRDIGTLRLVNDNYLRIETLHKANDIISNATAELLIFKHYTIHEPAPFASIDGQKFKCRINTFKARYSSKYFKHRFSQAL